MADPKDAQTPVAHGAVFPDSESIGNDRANSLPSVDDEENSVSLVSLFTQYN